MIRVRRRLVLLGACVLGVSACGGLVSGSGGNANERTVLVDYVHDEVASSFLYYFPRDVVIHPGDTVVFKQEWTGEPHSVTMGTLVDDMLGTIRPLMEQYAGVPDSEIPPEAMRAYQEATSSLPPMADDETMTVIQAAAQPCFLDEGLPEVEDPSVPCAEEDQEQPAFDGTQSYYNSGFIPYAGEGGNEYRVPLSDDIAPGTYDYYCNLHGPGQSGTITVVPEDEPIPSQADVNRQAREEIDAVAEKLIAAYDSISESGRGTAFGQAFDVPVAGWGTDDPDVHAFISEFVPETIEAEAGEPVTWDIVGFHTVSFDVPRYFSHVDVEEDGTVVLNQDAFRPIDVQVPAPPEATEGEPDGPPQPVVIDGGEWDGEGFRSTGAQFNARFTMTFSEPGTYRYACLVHPQMVGTVTVK